MELFIFEFWSEHVKVDEGSAYCEFLMPDYSKLTMILVAGDVVFEQSTFELANNGQNIIVALAFGEEFIIEPGTQVSFVPSVEFNPDTLNLQSNGKWITAYIEPPINYELSEINLDPISLETNGDSFDPDPTMVPSIGDYDSDGFSDVMIKFLSEVASSFDVVDYQSETANANEVTFTVSGIYIQGISYSCSDTIRVLSSNK